MSSLEYFRQMAAIKINVKPLLISIPVFFVYSSTKFILFWFWPQPITTRETDIQYMQKWLDC